MFAPRPSAAVATACCGWYPSITVRMSSRSAIMVVPCCAHGQHTNCLMKCMVEVHSCYSLNPYYYLIFTLFCTICCDLKLCLCKLKLNCSLVSNTSYGAGKYFISSYCSTATDLEVHR
uniref:Uncharacterized protein n=3 Tax=Oryza TaxID=4527 RepID=A0A0E0FVI9_ORYNI